MSPETTPLAIVGMACLFPKADGLEGYWANIKQGVDGITEIPASHWPTEAYFDADPKKPDMTYAKRGGFLSPVAFDPAEFGISPNNLEATDASQLLGLVVAREALRDAGYGPETAFNRDRTSVILGVTGTLQLAIPLGARLGHPIWRKALAEAGIEGETADQIVERIADGYVGWQENSFPGLLGNVVAGRIANRLDLGGTNCVVDAACGSSLSATHMAALELQSGRADMVVTGGVDTFNDIFMYMCFSKTPALSPTGNSRPFDAEGDGTIIGEGIGMVVLKRLADAERDGDQIYAVLKSVGSSSDGRGKAIYAPSADGQQKALQEAYALAGVSPETIELVEGHGTGTKVGDATEVSALAEVYGEASEGPWVALGSVKSQIGHTKAAAGVAGLIKAALAVHHKVLPPTLKVSQPLPILEGGQTPFYLTDAPRPWLGREGHPRRAAVSAFGFGGSNFHAVLEEHKADKPGADWDGSVQIVAISGETPAAIEQALAGLSAEMAWDDMRAAAARANASFSATAAHRLVLVVERNRTDLKSLLANAKAQLKEGRASWQTPDGAYYGSGEAAGKLAMLFPGQGAQYVGMGRELFCHFPEMLEALREADYAFAGGQEAPRGQRLSDRIVPPTAFGSEAQARQEAALRATQAAQPGIGAFSYGAYRVLQGFGLAPQAVAGHSYGELTALAAAGRLAAADFFKLSVLRGRLMGEGEGDRGTMLAIAAPLAEVERVIRERHLTVGIANKNTPSQCVLSGASEAIAAAKAAFDAEGLKAIPLSVAAAFHSPLVAEAQHPLREALAGIELAEGAIEVYANTTGAVYPAEAEAARDLLAGQLAAPVEWVAQIRAMHAAGCRTFLEVGPGARLSGMVRQILEGEAHVAIAIDASNGKRSGLGDLARALAQVAALGHPVAIDRWEDGLEGVQHLTSRKKPAMTVPISGVNYRAPRKPLPPITKKLAPVNGNGNGVSHAPAPAVRASAPVNGNGNGQGYTNGNGHHAPAAMRPAPAPVAPAPTPVVPAPQPGPAPAVLDALKASQESLAALQKLQEQTAMLHRQFLEGQQSTQEAFKRLLEQQQQAFSQPQPVSQPVAMPAVPAAPVAPVMPAPARQPVVAVPAPVARPAVTAPVAPRPAAPVAAPSRSVEPVLLGVVAEKTGYPVEMLNLDMELEADLGIDSIKRVEILSALQEKLPEAPAVKPEHLGTLRTLGQIAGFLSAGSPAAAPTPTGAPARDVSGVLLAVVAEKTGYPAEMLNLEMELEADLGIDSIKRVEILSALQEQLPEAPAVKPEHLGTLRTLGQIAGFLSQGMPAAAPVAAPVAPAQDVSGVLLAIVAEKTGYPTEMLNLSMELEADLGIDSIKRVEILSALQEQLPQAPTVKPEHLGTLRTLGQIAEFLSAGMPAVAAAPVAAPGRDVTGILLAIVAEKTGYPAEMLNPEMELEADLGIDSIKRVEILSTIQEQLPEAPVVKPEHLGTLRTLRQIAEYLGAGAPAAPVAAPAASGLSAERVARAVLEVVADKTGYPVEMLNLSMELEADLGIDSIKRVEILSALQEKLPEAPTVKPEHLGTLRTLQQVVDFLAPSQPTPPTPPSGGIAHPASQPSTPAPASEAGFGWLSRQALKAVPLSGSRAPYALPEGATIWIADDGSSLGRTLMAYLRGLGYQPRLVPLPGALPAPDALNALIVLAPEPESAQGLWTEREERWLKSAFTLVQHAGPALRQAQGALLTVSRMDGAFGLTAPAGIEPTQGGLAGLAKTAGHEWAEVACKALDVPASGLTDEALAAAITRELLARGPVEVGLSADGPVTLALEEVALEPDQAMPLESGDVVVISGGARGVTAEVAVALAQRCQPTLVLLGRTAEPAAEPEWLAGLADEPAIKQGLLAHAGGPLAPKALQEQFQQVMANREVRRNLDRMRAAGSHVLYRAVDVRDAEAVAALLDQIRQEAGPIRGLVHGAGVLADRRIEDKTAAQIDMVLDTKVAGLRALLGATQQDDLKVLVMFSSVTGRQGRTGQVDYAMGNEALNKACQVQAALRPGCRAVSVNWGPWDGGMVTPGLKKVFAEEGIGLVPLEGGAAYLVEELAQGHSAPVEVLVMGRVGSAPAPKPVKLRTAFTRELDVAQHPFLASHVMNGKAVLPVAVIVEWLAHGALHANPGLQFAGLEDFRVFKGVVLEGEAPYGIRVAASGAAKHDGAHHVTVELRSHDDRDVLHARATVVLAAQPPVAPAQAVSRPALQPYGLSASAAYREVLFHGPHFQGIQAVEGISAAGIAGLVAAAPHPAEWIAAPMRDTWIADPLALDAAFQLMILWSVERTGAPCLPCHAGRYRQYAPFPADGVTVVARVIEHKGSRLVADIDFLDAQGRLVAALEGAESTVEPSLAASFQRNALAQTVQS